MYLPVHEFDISRELAFLNVVNMGLPFEALSQIWQLNIACFFTLGYTILNCLHFITFILKLRKTQLISKSSPAFLLIYLLPTFEIT